MSGDPFSPRIAVFTHDTFGLGHVRRCLHIVKALAERVPKAAILFVTGSPALHHFWDLPQNADYVKIPTIAKTGSKASRPPHLPLALAEVSLLRERLIQEAVVAFAPDVFLVDNHPLGSGRELLRTLHELRRLPTRTILGLRDIHDAPDVVRADWTRLGMYEVLDHYYDRILVYGMREVLDIADAYALPARLAEKLHYCGYVTAMVPPRRAPAEVRVELGITGPFVMATGGGGGDGFPLLQVFLQALPLIPNTSAVVFTGPLMGSSERAELRLLAAGRQNVKIFDYVKDFPSYLAAADVVVSMCGYNTAMEIVALQSRAIVVPRTWRYGEHVNRERAGVEREQLLRAQGLAKLGLVNLLEPEALTTERLAERIAAALAGPKPEPKMSLDLRGIECATNHILAMAQEQEGSSRVRP